MASENSMTRAELYMMVDKKLKELGIGPSYYPLNSIKIAQMQKTSQSLS